MTKQEEPRGIEFSIDKSTIKVPQVISKQEEIEEGIRQTLSEGLWDVAERIMNLPKKELCLLPEQREDWLNKILSYLHSQGVVIKVDGELPPIIRSTVKNYNGMRGLLIQKDMIEAGYVAVEPLIKEL